MKTVFLFLALFLLVAALLRCGMLFRGLRARSHERRQPPGDGQE